MSPSDNGIHENSVDMTLTERWLQDAEEAFSSNTDYDQVTAAAMTALAETPTPEQMNSAIDTPDFTWDLIGANGQRSPNYVVGVDPANDADDLRASQGYHYVDSLNELLALNANIENSVVYVRGNQTFYRNINGEWLDVAQDDDANTPDEPETVEDLDVRATLRHIQDNGNVYHYGTTEGFREANEHEPGSLVHVDDIRTTYYIDERGVPIEVHAALDPIADVTREQVMLRARRSGVTHRAAQYADQMHLSQLRLQEALNNAEAENRRNYAAFARERDRQALGIDSNDLVEEGTEPEWTWTQSQWQAHNLGNVVQTTPSQTMTGLREQLDSSNVTYANNLTTEDVERYLTDVNTSTIGSTWQYRGFTGASGAQAFHDAMERQMYPGFVGKTEWIKFFRYTVNKRVMKHLVVYDLNSVPHMADASLDQVFDYFEKSGRLLYDGEQGNTPIVINLTEAQSIAVDVSKYKDVDELADFLARKIIDDCNLIPLQRNGQSH